jgi:hypothetical protein
MFVERKTKTVIDETLLRRVKVNPEIFGGKPIIRGMRISVELILSLLGKLLRPSSRTTLIWNLMTSGPVLLMLTP